MTKGETSLSPFILYFAELSMKPKWVILAVFLALWFSCRKDEKINPGNLQILKVSAGDKLIQAGIPTIDIDVNSTFTITFSSALDTLSAKQSIFIKKASDQSLVGLNSIFRENNSIIEIIPQSPLEFNTTYHLILTNQLRGKKGETFTGIQYEFRTSEKLLTLQSVFLNNHPFQSGSYLKDVPFDSINLVITFSEPISGENLQSFFGLIPATPLQYSLSNNGYTVNITNTAPLDYYRRYTFYISSQLKSIEGSVFKGFSNHFITGLNPSIKKPLISDEELLDLVQLHTFRYFYDFAHPVSGLARERNNSGDVVTIGGSGFGLMALLCGIHRQFITRQEGIDRLEKVVDFLTTADRFHGVWPHWLNGNTGKVIPFGPKDDGADLVETAFMAAGLITVRQFLDEQIPREAILKDKINFLLNTIEWNWFTRGGQNVLYWHWSPNYQWAMNMQIKGYNEALIVYVLAAMPGNYSIEPSVYHNGWAGNGAIINGKSFYGFTLPVGYDYGGPLFFAHYSFLGLDPRNLSDAYASYWTQNVNHTLINRQHCIVNPFGHSGYGPDCWGLTASDDPQGYKVHEPVRGRDNGTISPTAALSSMPFTPEESLQALRHFYFILGDKLWGEYGFYDAFNPGQGWWANSYLAIDQGPIVVMIENYRSQLLWDLFMSAPEVQEALTRLGFTFTKK